MIGEERTVVDGNETRRYDSYSLTTSTLPGGAA